MFQGKRTSYLLGGGLFLEIGVVRCFRPFQGGSSGAWFVIKFYIVRD